MQLRLGEIAGRRVEQIAAVLPADAGGTDRTAEGNARQRQRRRGAQQCRDVRIDVRVHRQHRRHDLHVVVEAVREQRPDRRSMSAK